MIFFLWVSLFFLTSCGLHRAQPKPEAKKEVFYKGKAFISFNNLHGYGNFLISSDFFYLKIYTPWRFPAGFLFWEKNKPSRYFLFLSLKNTLYVLKNQDKAFNLKNKFLKNRHGKLVIKKDSKRIVIAWKILKIQKVIKGRTFSNLKKEIQQTIKKAQKVIVLTF